MWKVAVTAMLLLQAMVLLLASFLCMGVAKRRVLELEQRVVELHNAKVIDFQEAKAWHAAKASMSDPSDVQSVSHMANGLFGGRQITGMAASFALCAMVNLVVSGVMAMTLLFVWPRQLHSSHAQPPPTA